LTHIKHLNLNKIEKDILLNNLVEKKYVTPTKKEFKELSNELVSEINKGRYVKTRNILTVCIFFNYEETFKILKKKGIFRYYNYINKKCIIKNIAIECLEISSKLKILKEEDKKYLNSIINYSKILEVYNSIDKIILNGIKLFENKYPNKSFIKTLLSFTDFLFISNFYPKKTDNLLDLASHSKENISSAVSYLIHIYTSYLGDREMDINKVAENYLKSDEFLKIIISTCFFLDFKEFEIFIEHFNYDCILENNNIRIQAPFENFEKSIRLGYIKTEIQVFNDFFLVDDAMSFEDLVNSLNKQDKFKFFKHTETHNYPRYILELPDSLFIILNERFIQPDALFKDEILYLSSIFKEQLLNPDSLHSLKIKEDLSLFEFIKIRRVFMLLYLLFTKEIYKIEKLETTLLLHSLIPILKKEPFYKLIGVFSNEKIETFLDIVCWEPNQNDFFDLQYQPIIFYKDNFLISLSIFINSNSIRNLFASQYKLNNSSLLSDGVIDPLVDNLCYILNTAKIESYKETKLTNTDIDVFITYDNTIFIFECKHNLLPTSAYDLRTTYDYIKKAEKQLDKIKEEFTKGNLIKLLEKKHNVKLDHISNIICVIVLSNRMFNGNIFRYPIRNINEIDNLFNRGTMRTENGKFWIWKQKHLTIDDLLEYFSLENYFISLFYGSLTEKVKKYQLKDITISFETFSLDMKNAKAILKNYTNNLEIVKI
jgi:hypothetical protein